MEYDLSEHRHRFAIWAAARASQRGFTTVANLRDALEATDIRQVLADPQSLQVSAARFDELHRRWCSSILAFLTRRQIPKLTYGRAAKLVAVYLKSIIIMGEHSGSALGRNLHPPIDRILLQALAYSTEISSPQKAGWRSINWTQLNEAEYYELIDQLRGALPQAAPFWRLEEHWQPSDGGDGGA
jgi:hypothetical protein